MSLPVVEPLPWDSGFLGLAVGRLVAHHLSATHLAAIMAAGRAAGTQLIYLITDPADAETAAAARHLGARLADRKVTFARPAAGPAITCAFTNGADDIIESVSAYTPQLERLAWQSGEFSRFRRDEKFAPRVFLDLYSHWLRVSLSGERARVVLAAYSPAGIETGLLTLGEAAGVADIGLLAVDVAARSQGLGSQLVEAARQQALGWGCARLQVVTQRDNLPACRLYAHCGFRPVREEHIYHLWL